MQIHGAGRADHKEKFATNRKDWKQTLHNAVGEIQGI
jgi:hypothetical protein